MNMHVIYIYIHTHTHTHTLNSGICNVRLVPDLLQRKYWVSMDVYMNMHVLYIYIYISFSYIEYLARKHFLFTTTINLFMLCG